MKSDSENFDENDKNLLDSLAQNKETVAPYWSRAWEGSWVLPRGPSQGQPIKITWSINPVGQLPPEKDVEVRCIVDQV